ncbi:hypothetical protein HBI81_126540 [Parastagonospora nodorum]|nr:hypothetical protein HBH73_135930 [Parastagonospora nodorum]KAH5090319.1 hypothetical protein HBH72_219070 [Parastagonospora nodorum]KAH6526236.1 hypothetical protein HBI81_126540 [Parastagonospora nodorum]
MACATMYYTVHTHSLASWTAKKDYCEFQKNFENGTTASQCSISRPPAKRAMATPWIFASDNAWGKLLSSFPTRSNLERIAAIGVIIVITALHFCDLSSLWYRIARGKQPSGSYFTVSWPKIYTPLQARLSLWLPVDTILPDDYNDQDSYIRGHGRNLQTNVISREIQELEKRLNNAAKGISLALQESRRSRRANDQMMSIIFPICFALQYFYGETIILLFERKDTSFFIALVVLIIVLPLMSDIVGTILTCWIAGKMRIKDSEAYPLD